MRFLCGVALALGAWSQELDVVTRDFYANRTALAKLGSKAKVTAVVMSFNHEQNIEAIVKQLHDEPGVGQVVAAEDGSNDGSLETWKRALTGKDRLVVTENVHEIRAYNGGARVASEEIVCFLQDDDLPTDVGWAQEVVDLFKTFRKERLAIVSGLAAEVCQVELGEMQVEHPAAMKNTKVTHPIPYVADVKGREVPFMFVTEAWLSPLCARADAWRAIGGFDETLSLPGEPGIGLDIHASLRAAALFGYTIGVHGAEFQRGIGGHGTVSDPAKAALRLRKRTEISARIRNVVGCRWPPEMLGHAFDLNEKLLSKRDGADQQRSSIDSQCRAFLNRPCPPKGKTPNNARDRRPAERPARPRIF